MKPRFTLLLLLLSLLSCTDERLRTGDLVFVFPGEPARTSSMSEAISQATGAAIHVGILEVDKDGVWVIDATDERGVDRHPLDTLIADFTSPEGCRPVLEFKRLRDNRKVGEYVRHAKSRLGRPYDWHFAAGEEAFYCSELVWACYEGVFPLKPMNFAAPDGSYPAFWKELFERLGEPIPQGAPGTSPQGLYDDPALVPLR